MITRKVIVTFQVEGWHWWPSAPADRAYLQHSHRHMFHFRVEAHVERGDRQIEFHDLLDAAKKQIQTKYFGSASCEDLAATVLHTIREDGWEEVFAVECWEDGENGARVETDE